MEAGGKEITWDGTTDSGATAPDGNYSFDIEATGPQGESVNATPYLKGTVDRVKLGGQGTRLLVDGAEIKMDRIRSVVQSGE